MAKSNRRILALALTSFGLVYAGTCFGLVEADLSPAQPCKAASPAATAQVMQTFEQRYGEAFGTSWIDVNGDGLCDLMIGYQPADPEHRTISEFFVVPGMPGGALVQRTRWRASGTGVSPEAVQVKGSPIPYLVTRTRDGFRHILRWDPEARLSKRSGFHDLGLQKGALLELSDDDRDVGIVRRFLSRRYVSEGVQQTRGEKYAAALAALNEAGNIDPKGAEINHHLGVVKSMAGTDADTKHERGAAWYFSRAVKQGIDDPKSAQYNRSLAAETHLRLAKTYEATQNAQAAAGSYRKYIALAPSAKRAQIEHRISALESAKPVFEAPKLNSRMAEEARKIRRVDAPSFQHLRNAVPAGPRVAPESAAPATQGTAKPEPARPAPHGLGFRQLQAAVKPAEVNQPAPRPAAPAPAQPAAQTPTVPPVAKPAAPAPAQPAKPAPVVAPAPQLAVKPELNVRAQAGAKPAAPAPTQPAAQTPAVHPVAKPAAPAPAQPATPTPVVPPVAQVKPAAPATQTPGAQVKPTEVSVRPQAGAKPAAPGPTPPATPSPQTTTQMASLSPKPSAAPANAAKPAPAPAAAAPDKGAAIRRELAAESEKQKRPLTPDQIEALVQYKLAHPDARIPDLVANPAAHTPKPPLATRAAPATKRP